jgi:hypothetical protein
MKFFIQASDPRPSGLVSANDSSLGEAIETIFPLRTDFALLGWNDVYVPLTYKYDISIIISDILSMLDSILASDAGSFAVYWPSNTFCARWILTWSATELHIATTWDSVIGGTESMLNNVPDLDLEKNAFLSEWKPLLRKVRESITTTSGSVDTRLMLVHLESTLSKLPADPIRDG